MLQLKNLTPYRAAIAVFPDESGVESLYITVKGTFVLGEKTMVAEEQVPVRFSDEFFGEPGSSSLKYASEVHLAKPSTDIVVMGNAYAPGNKPVSSLDVTVHVANRSKSIRVFGDRKWYLLNNQLRISPPKGFVTMPVIYERAYGGVHQCQDQAVGAVVEARNPVGLGFLGRRRKGEVEGQPLPNLEDPGSLISKPEDQPAPACFGYVAGNWEPRRSFAGTYDERWRRHRAPYLPADFDSRVFNAGHPDLLFPGYLTGGERVTISNMSRNGMIGFNLPMCHPDVAVLVDDSVATPTLNMETVLIEPDEMRLSLIWRAQVATDKKTLKVKEIVVKQQDGRPSGGC